MFNIAIVQRGARQQCEYEQPGLSIADLAAGRQRLATPRLGGVCPAHLKRTLAQLTEAVALFEPGADLARHRSCALERALTLKIAYERWSETTNADEFSEVAQRTLSELQAASALC